MVMQVNLNMTQKNVSVPVFGIGISSSLLRSVLDSREDVTGGKRRQYIPRSSVLAGTRLLLKSLQRFSVLLALEVAFVIAQGVYQVLPDEECPQVTRYAGVSSVMFVFGDSALDAGTNSHIASLSQAHFEPNGRTFFGRPTGRFTDGRTYADFFASSIGLAFPRPYLLRQDPWTILKEGVNYASGGSGVFQTTNANNGVISFPDQIRQFQRTYKLITGTLQNSYLAEKFFSESLIVIHIGGNDLITSLASPQQSLSTFLRNVTDVIEDGVGAIYQAGGRKFVFLGLGPVGCIPAVLLLFGVQDGTCVEAGNELSRAYNGALEDLVLNRLSRAFKDIRAIVGRPYETLHELIVNGTGLRFTGGVTACCGSGQYNAEVQCGKTRDIITNPPYDVCEDVNEHVFWDRYHLTDRAYGLVAARIWDGGQEFVTPMNLRTLVNL